MDWMVQRDELRRCRPRSETRFGRRQAPNFETGAVDRSCAVVDGTGRYAMQLGVARVSYAISLCKRVRSMTQSCRSPLRDQQVPK